MSWMVPPSPFELVKTIVKEGWRSLRDFLALCFIVGAVAMGVWGFVTGDREKEKESMKERVIATAADLVVSEVGDEAKQLDLQARARLIMETSHEHWMVGSQLDENEEFRLAVAALVICSDEGERARIMREWRFLQALGEAMEGGKPLDLDAVTDEDAGEPIGLLAIWKSVVAAKRGMLKAEFDAGKSQ
jgi:hypothetical protein